tara:strand:+ start:211 stop:420 length:210 start_codon:yes stop_codon:yes gene_type:complete
MLRESMKQKRGQQMKMKIDYEKAKQLLEEKPNLTEEEYNKRFWELWYETEVVIHDELNFIDVNNTGGKW